MLSRYGLSRHYEKMRDALRRAQPIEAAGQIAKVLGLKPPKTTDAVSLADTVTRLRYRGFKPAELAMLAADCKPVVKFEDIPQQDAGRFVRRFGHRYKLIVSTPYFKDRLILRSRPHGTADEGPLVTIYASRGDQGARLQQIERTAKEDVRSCGQLLGFPACCVEAFEANMLTAQGDQDAVNDDAIRALLSQTQQTLGHRLLDPLSDYELLAFYPCSVRCEAAIEVAERNLKALEITAPSAAKRAQQVLGRPVLFWRTPFFVVFDPEAAWQPNGKLRYQWAKVHAFDDIEVSKLQRLFGAMVLPALAKGDHVDIEDHRVRVWRGAKQVDEIVGNQDLAPVLSRWST